MKRDMNELFEEKFKIKQRLKDLGTLIEKSTQEFELLKHKLIELEIKYMELKEKIIER